MSRADANRPHLLQMVRAVPFQPFLLNLESGDRIAIEHQENIAFDAAENGLQDIYVISGRVRYWGNLSAITTVAVMDRGELPVGQSNGRR